ncbi:uncharacterized protein LOC142538673 [Primulina tabacum]|uniref:uncharacterized protein LOC142538673 n=1 Tax=Primulina tabacum TaxID=48773 RepID=UPI003F59EC1A
MYAMTHDETDNTNDMLAGNVLPNEMLAYALFDCGAIHSFVSRRFAKKLKLEHETLSKPLRVATPARKTIESHKVHRESKIYISDQIFEAELIQLNMIEFDIILGMYWLAKHQAMVDCKKKNVKLQTPNKKEIIYHGKAKEKKSLLSASQTWNAIKGGEEIYLAMINDVQEEAAPKLEDIIVVQEFPYVFPEDLPGAIPDREEEFEINLVPGATPNSEAPY